MGRVAEELGPLAVSKLTAPGLHFVGGVPGLALQVLPSGSRTWILRMMVAGKRRDMGLGGYPAVTLAQARKDASSARAKVRDGADPIEENRAARSKLQAERAAALTFEQCAGRFIKAHAPSWRNAKHGEQWRNTLQAYAFPVLGALLVRDVEVPHVMQVLEPIWTTKTETASRLRGRIEQVLDWATARGYREGLNPARWRGHLDKLLPAPAKIARIEHHRAMAIDDLPAFMARLRAADGMGAKALQFTILTAARSGEVRGATWSEIDLDAALWVVAFTRMKAGKEHRVPLSAAALELLRGLPRFADTDLVFPSPRGGMLSDMTLSAVLRRMQVDAVPHGFRSTFRDWAAERTHYPRELAEVALAHAVAGKTEAAYWRGDLLTKRIQMMADWSAFLALELPPVG